MGILQVYRRADLLVLLLVLLTCNESLAALAINRLTPTVTASGTSVSQQEQPVTTSEVSATQGPPSVRPRTGPYTPAPPLPVPSDDYDTAYEYPDGANSVALGLGVGPGEHEAPPALGPVSNRTEEGLEAEPGVIPEPELPSNSEEDIGEGPNVLSPEEKQPVVISDAELSLPDDSLADTDLHDHDLIDSVMYIYFGSSSHSHGTTSRQTLVAGGTISLLAQLLTLGTALKRLRMAPQDASAIALLNTALALGASNILFIFGVQAPHDRCLCRWIAVLQHYMHLTSCLWLLGISIIIYRRLSERSPRLRLHNFLAWFLPAVFVLICYLVTHENYETRRYCWMSVIRGMVLSYMVPVASLILVNTGLALVSLRILASWEEKQPISFSVNGINGPLVGEPPRKALRAAVMLLPLFAVSWFLGVVSLENPVTLVFPMLFIITTGFLNWMIWAFSHVIYPAWPRPNDPSCLDGNLGVCSGFPVLEARMLRGTHNNSHGSEPAAQPLLGSISTMPDSLLGAEMLELRLDTISTISTIST